MPERSSCSLGHLRDIQEHTACPTQHWTTWQEVCFPGFSLCRALSPSTLCLWKGSGHGGPRVGNYMVPVLRVRVCRILSSAEEGALPLFSRYLPISGLSSSRLRSVYFRVSIAEIVPAMATGISFRSSQTALICLWGGCV